MITRQQIVDEARTWLGTPFLHQGRLKGVGVDCAGVVAGVASSLGLIDPNSIPANYSHQPDGESMRKVLGETMDEIQISQVQPGDVLLFSFVRDPQHVGIVTELGILHSYAQVRKCIETSMDAIWQKRIRGAYRFRGIE